MTTDRFGWLRILAYLCLLFLGMLSVSAQGQTHSYCPTDGVCVWPGSQTFNAPITFNSTTVGYEVWTGDFLASNLFNIVLNPSVNSTANQFGLQAQMYDLTANTKTYSGQQQAVYGSYSHFGSGAAATILGGAFEGFNPGSGTTSVVYGVSGNAYCGGVAVVAENGTAQQNPSNNGNCTQLRGMAGTAINLSSGTAGTATSLYAGTVLNTGGGAVTTAVGLTIASQTAGSTNLALSSGLGTVKLGDVVNITGKTNLPAGTSGNLFMASGYSSPILGKIYAGDGSGWQFNISKRTGSVDTELFQFKDSGNLVVAGSVATSSLVNTGTLTLPTATGTLADVIASGTATFTTTAVGAGACQTTVTTAATNALTTDTISWAYASAPTAATDGMLHLLPYLTAGNVNFMRCNPTAGSITPTALVINWKVIR